MKNFHEPQQEKKIWIGRPIHDHGGLRQAMSPSKIMPPKSRFRVCRYHTIEIIQQ